MRRGSRGGFVDMRVVKNPVFTRQGEFSETIGRIQPSEIRALTNEIDKLFRRDMRRLFSTEGASGGEKWAPLSARYKKWKQKKFPGRKILTRTGALRKSLTQKSTQHIARWYLKPRAVIELGSENRVGAYHVEGGPTLPVRDPLQTTEQQNSDYMAEVRKLFGQKLRRMARQMAAASRIRRTGFGGA